MDIDSCRKKTNHKIMLPAAVNFGLPPEVIQNIASFIEKDHNLMNFMLSCWGVYHSTIYPQSGVWRHRFTQFFDLPPGKSGKELQVSYMKRKLIQRYFLSRNVTLQAILSNCTRSPKSRNLLQQAGTFFSLGKSKDEVEILKMMQNLTLESFESPNGSCLKSKNIDFLESICESTNLLNCVLQHSPKFKISPLLAVMQLVLFHKTLTLPAKSSNHHSFNASQKVAYQDPVKVPIFRGRKKNKVNLDWALHISNFFSYHIKSTAESTLWPYFNELQDWEKPKAWDKKLEDATSILGKNWLGSYTYLDGPEDISAFRDTSAFNEDCDHQFIDNINEASDGPFQASLEKAPVKFTTLSFTFPDTFVKSFPDAFDAHINPQPHESLDKKYAAKRFTATGKDGENTFLCDGYIHGLPPQENIPGWQRISFVKYYMEDLIREEIALEDDTLDNSSASMTVASGFAWAYEGVVLPSKKIILGRWWRCESEDNEFDDGQYLGPCIFWQIEDEPK
ncbi:MAG: hypothetical protein M1834_001997 [Cirrosporium novae-zelandiae]|nr:MAG: hypothetical protein M1834_001997 [Cirrosporium novae-zelandiae]